MCLDNFSIHYRGPRTLLVTWVTNSKPSQVMIHIKILQYRFWSWLLGIHWDQVSSKSDRWFQRISSLKFITNWPIWSRILWVRLFFFFFCRFFNPLHWVIILTKFRQNQINGFRGKVFQRLSNILSHLAPLLISLGVKLFFSKYFDPHPKRHLKIQNYFTQFAPTTQSTGGTDSWSWYSDPHPLVIIVTKIHKNLASGFKGEFVTWSFHFSGGQKLCQESKQKTVHMESLYIFNYEHHFRFFTQNFKSGIHNEDNEDISELASPYCITLFLFLWVCLPCSMYNLAYRDEFLISF